MKYIITALAFMAALPANAHSGAGAAHNDGFFANLLHYLTQPAHMAYLVLGAVIGFFIVRAKTRSQEK